MPSNPLRAMREASGLSLREVARRISINPGRLSVIERGVEPTPMERAAIMSVLLPLLQVQAAQDARRIEP